MTIKAKKSKINLREKLAELLNFRQIRDRLDGLGLYLGKDRTGTAENLAVRGGANVDDLQLAEISAALGGTAVDVFVYDTRNDSDGGKWRERTQHTSWYNEELNTATRGGRREFPAVAVIVAEADKVTIYDGDDPDLAMWMVFNASGGRMIWATQLSCVSSLNARLSIGSPASGFRYIDFVSDKMREWRTSGVNSISGDISERNSGSLTLIDIPGQDVIVNQIINDVAMTVLPNAPIDSDTGLPVPTIAVATDGGYSIIKDDGTVVDGICTQNLHNKVEKIAFTDDNRVTYIGFDYNTQERGRFIRVDDLISTDTTITTAGDQTQNSSAFYGKAISTDFEGNLSLNISAYVGESFIEAKDGSIMFGNVQNLFLIDENISSPSEGMHAGISTDFNTGWMPGDIKLAALSDTKNETVGVDETELVSNGTFDSNTNDWSSPSSTTLSVDNQRLKLQGGGDPYPSAYTLVNVVEGIEYEVSAQYISNSNSFSGRIRVSSSSPLGGDIINGDIKTPGNNHIYRFTAPSTGSVYVALILQDVNGNSSGIWDNISVKQTGELITNGTFDNNYTGWYGEDANLTNANHPDSGSNSLLVTPTASVGKAIQDVTTVSGQKYVLSADIAFGAGCTKITIADNTGVIINRDYYPGDGNRTVAIDFDGNASMSNLQLAVYGGSAYFDNISVRLAEDDRSVNDNGLQIFGEIDKTPVAPGADLVGYQVSDGNYLLQPENDDLAFGTDDFAYMFWAKATDATNTSYICSAEDTAGVRIALSGGHFRFHTYDASNNVSYADTDDYTPTGKWVHVVCVRRNGVLEIYRDGEYNINSHISGTTVRTLPAVKTTVLSAENGTTTFHGQLALFRISATAPTPEQIAKIYRDEKVLFQDGAQATLYGTSDAVTALAYDDKTELLHVGTSSGRSDFAGLRRINNTTIPVTTSISASNNLIAEQ